MLFNTVEFGVFFAVFFLLYYTMPFRYRWILLLVASYYFYMAWKAEYVLLILFSTTVDYLCGIKMESVPDQSTKKNIFRISLLINMSMLLFFKYFNFVNESFRSLFTMLHIGYAIPALNILLPVGISFYTFQSLSYTIDVYKGNIKPEKNFGIFALYVSFFPQLVAGPIERASNLLPQFRHRIHFDYENIRSGLVLMAWGLFKKIVIADRIAIIVDQIYDHPQTAYGIVPLLGTLFFAVQIYCDFSGYSDIAIGSAQVLGFKLMKNFNRPYYAKSIAEFWRRWHISLSTWFKDYLYIPLGGNRVIKWRWYYNLFITFLVSGLWHGADWTFLTWGALHGFYLVFSLISAPLRRRMVSRLHLDRYKLALRYMRVFITFALVNLGWVFFRANTMSDALLILRNIFSLSHYRLSDLLAFLPTAKVSVFEFSTMLGAIGVLELVQLYQRNASIRAMVFSKPGMLRWSLYLLLIFTIILFSNVNQYRFIYFQF